MFTKILIVAAVVAVALAVYGMLAGFNGWWPFGGGGNGYRNGTATNANQETARSPESFTVEIHEGTIMYMHHEVTLDELEEILERYQYLDEVWILTDAFRAYSVTFESVRALFRAFNIAFAES
ncbi:MAG: hypothetical protein FWC71_10015 [Defluviitaleaceae bacterium]|nr:hypothetical protein [Defluviitaleaceae bacterium]